MIEIKNINDDNFNVVKKAWGEEVILHNSSRYCGKLLRFKAGAMFSMHFHDIKDETWYVNKGSFNLYYINLKNAEKFVVRIGVGYVIDIPRLLPHQLEAIEDSEIFEVSSWHLDEDSFRIEGGDSQK